MYRFRDKRRFQLKIEKIPYPMHFFWVSLEFFFNDGMGGGWLKLE